MQYTKYIEKYIETKRTHMYAIVKDVLQGK